MNCSSFFPPNINGQDIHGAYFATEGTINLMRQVLKGIDRGFVTKPGQAPQPALQAQ